jgi:vancomycin resistance protein YoaR
VSATLHERIAARAFEHYERRIRQSPLDDWLQAEQEILEQKNTRHAEMPHRGGYASEEQGSPIITQATSDAIEEQIVARQTTQIPSIAPLSSCS